MSRGSPTTRDDSASAAPSAQPSAPGAGTSSILQSAPRATRIVEVFSPKHFSTVPYSLFPIAPNGFSIAHPVSTTPCSLRHVHVQRELSSDDT